MKNKLIIATLLGTLLTIALPSQAENLVEVYKQAMNSDPAFKKARSDWFSAQQDLAISQAAFYPNISVGAYVGPSYGRISDRNPSPTGSPLTEHAYWIDSPSNNVSLNLSQKIFDYSSWKKINTARFSTKASTAQYLASIQDLIARTAMTYFDVLSAAEQLDLAIAKKEAVLQQRLTQEQKFKVGLIAITDVYDAQAAYDAAVANEITARHSLANELENLRAITGKNYSSLTGLKKEIPLVMPKPSSIEAWVHTAGQHNYAIQRDLNIFLATGETVKATAAGRYPTVALAAQAKDSFGGYDLKAATPAGGGRAGLLKTNTVQVSAGLSVQFPFYQGGLVSASAKKQAYLYLSASNQLELTHRLVESSTRQAYLDINSGISQIRADKQAVVSAINQLKATKASYRVGTRTMVDVLQAVSALYEKQQTWSKDRYAYILSLITLKQNAGTLSPEDLARISAWLSKPRSFNLNSPVKIQPAEDLASLQLPQTLGDDTSKVAPSTSKEDQAEKVIPAIPKQDHPEKAVKKAEPAEKM